MLAPIRQRVLRRLIRICTACKVQIMANDVYKFVHLLRVCQLDNKFPVKISVSKRCRPGQTPRIAAPYPGPHRLQKSQIKSGLMSADFSINIDWTSQFLVYCFPDYLDRKFCEHTVQTPNRCRVLRPLICA